MVFRVSSLSTLSAVGLDLLVFHWHFAFLGSLQIIINITIIISYQDLVVRWFNALLFCLRFVESPQEVHLHFQLLVLSNKLLDLVMIGSILTHLLREDFLHLRSR